MNGGARSGRAGDDLRRAATRFDAGAHVPFLCDGARVGWLRKTHAQRLLAWPEIFKRNARSVRIAEALASAWARTAAVDGVVQALHQERVITGWRNERYAVATAFDAPARFFGMTTYAAHANGYCGAGAARANCGNAAWRRPNDAGREAGRA